MRGRRVWAGRAIPALLAAVLLVAGCTGQTGGGAPAADPAASPAGAAANAFLQAWAAGHDDEAARLTDDPGAAEPALVEVRRALQVRGMTARLSALTPGSGGAQAAAYEATMSLPGLGDWTYPGSLSVVEADSGGQQRWLVDWSPSAVHPQLKPETRLTRTRALLPRAAILDRAGQPLTAERPVVVVGIEPRRLTKKGKRAYRALDKLDVDTRALARRVTAARPDAFVTAIALRQPDFARVDADLRPIPGIVFRKESRTLAPTASYGRAVLGSVRTATAETLEQAGPLAAPSDSVGDDGLQQAFQIQLAGEPSGRVQLVDRSTGALVSTLHEFPGKPGTPLRTTLDARVQTAAETALKEVPTNASIVALQPSTGQVLAAANSAPAGADNKAFVGRYPPGSTFKIVTTAALLQGGLNPAQILPCPKTLTAGGKSFKNYDELGELGNISFARAFADSCNTAFVAVSDRLPPGSLPSAAAQFGLGLPLPADLGLPAFGGSVPEPGDDADRAASALGQARLLASPLAMALVAATVANGAYRPPLLLPDGPPPGAASASGGPTASAGPASTGSSPAPAPAPLAASTLATLRALMRQTVLTGTGHALRLPGAPVSAKSGTAEYGDDDPPHQHAWMVGYRGDLAFAVLVEDGESGARTAGPVARSFLAAAP